MLTSLEEAHFWAQKWEKDYSLLKEKISVHKRESLQAFSVRPPSLIRVDSSKTLHYASNLVFEEVEKPRISIIIPVFGQITTSLECLGSIARANVIHSYEVIVADDASPDETANVLSSIKGIHLLRQKKNIGFLRNCNSAFSLVRGEYVIFVNSDVQVFNGWLDGLLSVFSEYPNVGAVAPKIIYPSGYLQEAGTSLLFDGRSDMIGLHDDPRLARYDYTRPVDYCSGAAMMLPTRLFEELKGFSDEFSPAYYEDVDLCLRLNELGYKSYYAANVTVAHHLSKTMGQHSVKRLLLASRNITRLYDKWSERIDSLSSVKVIAFYLPQFHSIPENNHWWGENFTEWTNVRKAKPNFQGHYQPHEPADLGYYDLNDADVMERQVNLARRYGIDGFCFYYYWFAGKRLLEMPIERMLSTEKPAFPFCLCWANENWSRRWDGGNHELLMEQQHSPEDDRAVILDLIRYFRSTHYIRIDGRPLLLIYRVTLFPDFKATSQRWRDICRLEGIGEIYLAMVESMELFNSSANPLTFGCDAAVQFPPHGMFNETHENRGLINKHFTGCVSDYVETAYKSCAQPLPAYKQFQTAMPSWDNTPRRQNDGVCFENISPGVFQAWLEHIIFQTRQQMQGDERLVFVNAWNEWGEGAHLEPDMKYGHAFLEAVLNAKSAEKLLCTDHYDSENSQ